MRTAIILALSLSLAAAIDFQSEALKNYHSCGEMSKSECLTWHEAQDACGGPSCSQAGQGGTTTPSQGGTTAPPDDSSKDKGKGKGKKGGGSGKGCFHGDDTVTTNYGTMSVKDMLGKSDLQVLSQSADGSVVMAPVLSWLYADAERVMKFVEVTTATGNTLHLSSRHLIYQTDCQGSRQTLFAEKLTTGQCLMVNAEGGQLVESKIVGLETRMMKGAYAPVTTNGNIVVNDVLASCFTNHENEAAQMIIFRSVHAFRNAVAYLTPRAFLSNEQGVEIPQLFATFLDLAQSFLKY